MEQKNIIVTGYVDDVRPYIAKASLYIVPLRIGGGTRLKILEATRLLRKAINICMDIESAPQTRDMIISRLEVDLIICAWASGDYREALSRMTSLVEWL